MSAYSELYVNDAARSLGEYFDYMVCDLRYLIDEAFTWFSHSVCGRCFGEGNPHYISGMTGIELAQNVIYEVTKSWEDKEASQTVEKSREYWTGWAMAQYQWRNGSSFKELNERGLIASKVADMYILHEADVEKFYCEVDSMILPKVKSGQQLKRLRAYAGYTQKQLSEESGVALRMIQLYEQGQNDLRKASVDTVSCLSKALHCKIDDL